jgi:hypothetical protein
MPYIVALVSHCIRRFGKPRAFAFNAVSVNSVPLFQCFPEEMFDMRGKHILCPKARRLYGAARRLNVYLERISAILNVEEQVDALHVPDEALHSFLGLAHNYCRRFTVWARADIRKWKRDVEKIVEDTHKCLTSMEQADTTEEHEALRVTAVELFCKMIVRTDVMHANMLRASMIGKLLFSLNYAKIRADEATDPAEKAAMQKRAFLIHVDLIYITEARNVLLDIAEEELGEGSTPEARSVIQSFRGRRSGVLSIAGAMTVLGSALHPPQ